MNVAGVILAGGASRRMGSPKALLPVGGETILDRLIGIFASACDSVTVVLGCQAGAIRSGLARAGEAKFVTNPAPERGQLSSLQCALTLDGDSHVMYCPVDYPLIQAATVETLRASMQAEDLFVIPRYEGRRGHPILFQSCMREEFLRLPPDGQARDVVHAHVERTRYVDVPDRGILRDVDDQRDYAEALALLERP